MQRTRQISILVSIVVTALLTASASSAQSCSSPLGADPCRIDFVAAQVSPSCSSTSFLQVASPLQDSNGDDWLETVLRANVTDGCRLCVVLDYTETPTGYTLDLGDSATNNGQGGNNGGGESEAELQIRDEVLTAFSIGYGPSLLDRVVEQQLSLDQSSYKICVGNQSITWGQPAGSSSTPHGKALFALPDLAFDGNTDVFLGLNRVIHNLAGAPSPSNRVGTGLRRAYVTVE